MSARAIAATVAGIGLLLVGGGGAVVLGFAWVLNAMELSVLYWVLPLLAVAGGGLAAYGIVGIATDVLGDVDGVSSAVNDLGWRELKHYLD